MARDVEVNLTANDKTGTALTKAEQNFRKSSERIRKQQEDTNKKALGSFATLVEGVSPKLAQSLGSSVAGIGASIGPILVGAAVSAAPLMGAAISGAIIGGAGIGGVVGGVVLAARDARVQAAATDLGSRITSRLENAAVPFVQKTIDGIDQIDQALQSIDFEGIFRNSAQFVEPLVGSVRSLITDLGNGIEDLVANAGPAVSAISTGITEIGRSLGEGLSSLAQNGEAAAAGLQTLFGIINSAVQTTFTLVNALTQLYGISQKIGGDFVLQTFLKLTGAQMDNTGFSAHQAGAETNAMGAGFQAAAPKAGALNAQLAPMAPDLQAIAEASRAVYTANLALFNSETSLATALGAATKEIGKHKAGLATNSAEGLKNRAAISNVAGALQTQYDKYVQVNGVGPKSAAVADNLRGKFIALAQKTGLSASAAKNLADKILDIPDSHDTKITAKNEQALNAAREVNRAIDRVHGKTVTITVRQVLANGNVHVSGTGGSGTQIKGFDASSTWESAGGGRSRMGGPSQVSVDNRLLVSFDGGPYREYATRTVREDRKREKFREKVGHR